MPKKQRTPVFTKKNVKRVLPLLDAGLAMLSRVKPAAPYAQAARVLTQVGQMIPTGEQQLLKKMKEVRTQILTLEPTHASHEVELVSLRTQLMTYLDLLLDQV
jgi:hypothetical protein